jgi:DNA polymerase-3 subunit gamma/tau
MPRNDTPRNEVPRSEMSRGATRAALAPAPVAAPDVSMRRQEPDANVAPLVVGRFEDLIALAAEKRDLSTKTALERDVRLVRFEDGRLEIALEPSASKALISELSRKLGQWTGRRWMVVVSAEQGQPTVRSQTDARRSALEQGVRADPLVQAVLQQFPGAEIIAVRPREGDVVPSATPLSDSGEDQGVEPPFDDEPPFNDR